MAKALHALLVIAPLALGACRSSGGASSEPPPEPPPPSWHFSLQGEGLTSATLTGAWGRSDGVLFVVGWDGTILRRDPARTIEELPVWTRMPSGTTAHLTAIVGVENGDLFGVRRADGEMFAVGWHGTLLHYHPNPDGDATTDDGAWQVIAAPEGAGLTPLVRPDPNCPDYDGDGIADDGDGDGWAGNAPCSAGNDVACDDNCRTTANGTVRPVVDLGDGVSSTPDGCLESGVDGPDVVRYPPQRDDDGDALGRACDDDELTAHAAPRLDVTLFGVWARATADQLTVVAVGESGTVVTYQGASAAVAPVAPALPVADAAAWTSERGVGFRYDDDCDASTPSGQLCPGSGRLPPSCPAQCSPLATTCSCPPDQGQCCDANPTLTGAACVDASCPAAPNTCNSASGVCQSYCPGCFRHLDKTLRSVAGDGDVLMAAGADGTLLIGDANDPTQLWRAPICIPLPPPLDSRPLISAIAARGGGFHLVGQEGLVVAYPGASGCPFVPLASPSGSDPIGFLSAVYARSATRAWAVGDGGVLLDVGGSPSISPLDTEVTSGWQAVTETHSPINGQLEVWLAGASGSILLGRYY